MSHFVPTSNFAPARPHSRAISPIFAVVVSFLPAPSTCAHFFSIPTLFGHTIEPAISVTNSPAFALVVVGSYSHVDCIACFPFCPNSASF